MTKSNEVTILFFVGLVLVCADAALPAFGVSPAITQALGGTVTALVAALAGLLSLPPTWFSEIDPALVDIVAKFGMTLGAGLAFVGPMLGASAAAAKIVTVAGYVVSGISGYVHSQSLPERAVG